MEMSALPYILQGTYFNEQSNSHLNQDVNRTVPVSQAPFTVSRCSSTCMGSTFQKS